MEIHGDTITHRFHVKIYYEDTDAGGVVYYGNYLRYLERARTEFLQEHGISVSEFHNKGLFFVVTHVDIHYKRPGRLGETIEVTTEVAEMKNASLTLKSGIFRGADLLADACVTVACIDEDGKPHRLPESFKGLKS